MTGGNTIAFNRGDGVRVAESGPGNTIRGNSIYGNSGLGINLVGPRDRSDGVTLNDTGDRDGGPNDLQKFPVITDDNPGDNGGTTLAGTLNSVPNTTFALDFYSNSVPDPSGYGQGETFIGSANARTNAAGNANFSFTFNGDARFFSATATNRATGDTSEFSQVPLAIIGFDPASGPVGTLVTLNGAGFTDNVGVFFSDDNTTDGFIEADDVSLVSSTQILVRVPEGATTGPIGILTTDGNSVATSSATFTVTTGPAPPPANDDFANAQVISGKEGTVAGTNVNATLEDGEPTHADTGGDASVWYRWTAPATGSVSFSTQGSDFDTVLAVYTGTAVDDLTEVASNDDAGIGTQSVVHFHADAGQTYYIAVDGTDYGGITAQGKIVLTWLLANGRPPNDDFVHAQVLLGPAGRVTGTNVQATKEPGEPNHAGDVGGKSVWYRWTAPGSGTVTFTTANSDFDTLLAVYTGRSANANTVRTLRLVASNDDEDILLTSSVEFQATAGVTYYIAVDGYNYQDGFNGDEGHVVLDWDLNITTGNVVEWIKPVDGDWGTASNWKPARVPGPTDIATVDLPGRYTVRFNVDSTVGSLVLGGPNGRQTLALNGHTLTLNASSSVGTNGVVNLSQGVLNRARYAEHGRHFQLDRRPPRRVGRDDHPGRRRVQPERPGGRHQHQ